MDTNEHIHVTSRKTRNMPQVVVKAGEHILAFVETKLQARVLIRELRVLNPPSLELAEQIADRWVAKTLSY